jgi:hypothetical protein
MAVLGFLYCDCYCVKIKETIRFRKQSPYVLS